MRSARYFDAAHGRRERAGRERRRRRGRKGATRVGGEPAIGSLGAKGEESRGGMRAE